MNTTENTTRPATLGKSDSPLMLAHAERSLGHAKDLPEPLTDSSSMLATPDFRHLIPALAKSAGGTPEAWENAVWTAHSTAPLVCWDFIDYLHTVEELFWNSMEPQPE